MIEIALTQGCVAIVDDCDVHLATFKWHIRRDRGVIYAVRKIAETKASVFLHREVLGFGSGDPIVDHMNGNGLDCRRSNLRPASHLLNARNRSGAQKNNHSSGHLGVDLWRNRWVVRIRVKGKRIFVGSYLKLEEAVKARLEAEATHWGIQPRRASAHGLDAKAACGHLADTAGEVPHIPPTQAAPVDSATGAAAK